MVVPQVEVDSKPRCTASIRAALPLLISTLGPPPPLCYYLCVDVTQAVWRDRWLGNVPLCTRVGPLASKPVETSPLPRHFKASFPTSLTQNRDESCNKSSDLNKICILPRFTQLF